MQAAPYLAYLKPRGIIMTTQNVHNHHQALSKLLDQTPGLWRGSQNRPATGSTRSRPASHTIATPGNGDLFDDLAVNQDSPSPQPVLATGFSPLDKLLPHGGWPDSGLVEMICPHQGIGELQLLMPLLRERSQRQQSILWIAPPYPLHGPALTRSGINIRNSFVIPPQTSCNQALWSIEKALQSDECGLVLAWQNWLSARVIRRLQLAASEGGTLGILFHQRPTTNSPAALQLQLSSSVTPINQRETSTDRDRRSIDVRLLKAKGSYHQGQVKITLPC